MNINIFQRIRQKRRNKKQHRAYIELNNLYLSIEAGKVKLTRRVYDRLNELLSASERTHSIMWEYWVQEFRKLPGWRNV